MDAVEVTPTDEEVDTFLDGIPAKLSKCAAGKHNWRMQHWAPFSSTGKPLKPGADPRKAAFLDCTDVCGGQDDGGNTGCGLKRHYEMVWQRGKFKQATEFSYSDRNPLLVSPRGISRTGIVVRTEMADRKRSNQILGRVLYLAPAGDTKKAMARKVSA